LPSSNGISAEGVAPHAGAWIETGKRTDETEVPRVFLNLQKQGNFLRIFREFIVGFYLSRLIEWVEKSLKITSVTISINITFSFMLCVIPGDSSICGSYY